MFSPIQSYSVEAQPLRQLLFLLVCIFCVFDRTFRPDSIFVTRDDYDDKLVTCSYVAEKGVCSVHFIEKAPLYRPLFPYNGFLLSK